VIFKRERWHGQPDVRGEQSHDAIDVARLVGLREALNDVSFGRGVRGRRRVIVTPVGRLTAQRATRPLQRALHGLLGSFNDAGDFAGPKAQDISQDKDGSLARREQLQRGHEGKADRLPSLVSGFGPGRLIEEAVQENVRVRLEPQHLAVQGRLRRFDIQPGRFHW
jgi:hypothetical protein